MYPKIDHIESLSVVIPVFNEKESLTTLYEKLIDTLSEKTSGLELIFVDDGSQDGSTEILKQLAEKDNRITVVCFGEIAERQRHSVKDSGLPMESMSLP